MQVDNPKAAKLYTNLINDGYTSKNLGSIDEFSAALSDPTKADKIYNGLIGDGYTQANLGSQKEFMQTFTQPGFSAKINQGAPQKPLPINTEQPQQPEPVQPQAPTEENNFGLPSHNQLAQPVQSDNTNNVAPKEAIQAEVNQANIPVWNKQKADYKEKVIKSTPDAITNAAVKSLKIQGIDPSNAAQLNKEKQKFQDQVTNGNATVSFDKDGTPGLVQNPGFFSSLWDHLKEGVTGWYDARKFKDMSVDERVNYANGLQKQQSPYIGVKPTDAGSVGALAGDVAPTLGRYAAGAAAGVGLEALAPETGGLSNLALKPIMSFVTNAGVEADLSGMNGTLQRYYDLKSKNPDKSDKELMQEAGKGEDVDRLAGIGNAALFSTPANVLGKSVTSSFIKDAVKTGADIGAKTAIVEGAKDIGHNIEGVTNKSASDIAKDMGEAFAENAPMGTLLHAFMGTITGLAKVPPLIKSGLKYDIINKMTPDEVRSELAKNVQSGAITPVEAQTAEAKLNEYGQALQTVPPYLSDEAKASVAGLIIKRNNLLKQSEGLDKTAQDLVSPEVNAINNQIKEVYRTGKVEQVEINPTTGETYQKPEYDNIAQQRVQDLAQRIASGKTITKPEDIKTQADFPDELKAELQNHLKEDQQAGKEGTGVQENINEYLKQNDVPRTASDETKGISKEKPNNLAEQPIPPKVEGKESKFPKPEKPIHEMNSDELDKYADKVRKHNKGLAKEFFGEEGAKKYNEAQSVSNNYLIHRNDPRYKEANDLIDKMHNSLTPEQENEFFGVNAPKGLIYDDGEIRDVARKVRFVEESENADELATSVKNALSTFNRNEPTVESLAILNAAKKKAGELNIDPKDLIKNILEKVGGQYKDIQDAEFMMKNAFEKLTKKPEEPKQPSEPTNKVENNSENNKKEVPSNNESSDKIQNPSTIEDEAKDAEDSGDPVKAANTIKSIDAAIKSSPDQQARDNGEKTVDGRTVKRQKKVKAVIGKPVDLLFSKDEKQPAKYAVIEREDLQPSHKSGIKNENHFIPEAQPRDRGSMEVLKNEAKKKSDNLDPSQLAENNIAYFGSPIVNERGEVIQGNGRAEAIDYYYGDNKNDSKGYRKMIESKADELGLDKDEIAKMKEPVLVRMADVNDERAIILGNHTSSDLEDVKQKGADAKAGIGKLKQSDLAQLSNLVSSQIGEAGTLKGSIRDNAKPIIDLLMDKGILRGDNREMYFNKDGVTPEGVDAAYNMVKQLLFEGGGSDLQGKFDNLPFTQREAIEKTIPAILNHSELKNHIQKVIEILHEKNESGNKNFSTWERQIDMFNGKNPSDIYSGEDLGLASKIDGAKTQKEISTVIKQLSSDMNDKAADMFEPARKGLIFKDALRKSGVDFNEPVKLNKSEERIAKEQIKKSDAQQIIDNEGLTLENLNDYKHLFNGFPFTPEDFKNIKNELNDTKSSYTEPTTAGQESAGNVSNKESGNEAQIQSEPNKNSESGQVKDSKPTGTKSAGDVQPENAKQQHFEEIAGSKPSKVTGRIAVDPIIGGEAKDLTTILKDFSTTVKQKVFTSRVRRGAAGTYHPDSKGIKLKYSGDLDTTAHEVGHMIDDVHSILPEIRKNTQALKELTYFMDSPAASKPPKGHHDPLKYKQNEGFAEWLRAFIVNPKEAIDKAPEIYKIYNKSVDSKMQEAVKQLSNDIRSWAGASGRDQVLSNIEFKPEEAHGLIKKILTKKEHTGNFYISFADRMAATFTKPMRAFEKAFDYAKGIKGIDKVLPAEDPIILSRLLLGVDGKFGEIINNGMINSKNEVLKSSDGKVKNLNWLLEPLDNSDFESIKTDMEDVVAYMAAQRTIELSKRFERDNNISGSGGGIYRDLDVAKKAIDEFENGDPDKLKRVKEAASRYREFADDVLKYMVDKGRLAKDQYDEIKKNNLQYVAMNRILESEPGSEIVPFTGKAGKLGNSSAILHKIQGSTRKTQNPYTSLIDNVYSSIRESDRNEVLKSFRDMLVESRGMNDGPVKNFADIGVLGKEGDKNTIKIFINGKPEHWIFQQDIYKALKGLDDDAYKLPPIITFLPALLRNTVTKFPTFAVRNVWRDTQDRVIKSNASNLKDLFGDKEHWKDVARAGGLNAGFYVKDRAHYYGLLETTMDDMSKNKKFILADPVRLKEVWERYEGLLQKSETVNRVAEYRGRFRKAKSEGMDDYNSMLYSAYHARDLIDFAVAGHWMKILNQIVPFSNAAVQGIRSAVVKMKENPGGFAARMMIYSVLPNMALWWWNHRDDDTAKEYEDLPSYQKDLYWNAKIGDNKWLAMPKPYELSLTGAGVDRLLSKVVYGKEDAFEGYAGNVYRTLMPIDDANFGAPITPIVEAATNHDFFRNKYIIPANEDNLNLALRHTETASRLGQLLQQATGIDGRKIDFFVRGQFSYTGNAAIKLSDLGKENDKNTFNLSDLGFFKQSPAYNSPSVQDMLNFAEEWNLKQSRDYREFSKEARDYFDSETDADKDRLAKPLIEHAKLLLMKWKKEGIDKQKVEKFNEKNKK